MMNPDVSDPAQVKAFLETLSFSLQVAGWTWPVRPLLQIADRITQTKTTWAHPTAATQETR